MHSYNDRIECMRREEFPMLNGQLYLDHAGTTLYSKRLLDRFHSDMISHLYGNPHSASPSSQYSTNAIDQIRLRALEHFHADPEDFDLIFTANTTAAIKLVADAFRDSPRGFRFGYHVDCHTSMVGVRELSAEAQCLSSDGSVDRWLKYTQSQCHNVPNLFAYSAQSNMNGRRLSLTWHKKLAGFPNQHVYTFLDAASYVSTSPLYLNDTSAAPDLMAISFSKIFGFPDLGGLIVKKSAGHVFDHRKYFGGGTVDTVVCANEQWHVNKSTTLHDRLEDGTLPIHNILALGSALRTHSELFESLEEIAKHTSFLIQRLHAGLTSLRHENHRPVCKIYEAPDSKYNDPSRQGPIIAFNLRDYRGAWVSNAEVEKLASIKNIHLRTGGLCNPGGTASALDLAPWEIRENFSAGFRCGSENDILNGKPTGVIRVSLGAMSTIRDVDKFLSFIEEFFVHHTPPSPFPRPNPYQRQLYIESLTVYPIKSCAGWSVPSNMPWDVRSEGLAWDREWCVVQRLGGAALSQKKNRRMALIRPQLDFRAGVLRIGLVGSTSQITVPLSHNPGPFDSDTPAASARSLTASVCGDAIEARVYTSTAIADFFTAALGMPCTLARFPPARLGSGMTNIRHSKPHLMRGSSGDGIPSSGPPHPLLLSNESPILTITRSSLDRLNETIKAAGGRTVPPAVFRANLVLAENPAAGIGAERAWAEDTWTGMWVGSAGTARKVTRCEPTERDRDEGEEQEDATRAAEFEFLGGCRRCQMVCVDPESGERNQEPFVTLAKTRRFRGRVLFGVHTALARDGRSGRTSGPVMIRVGDTVVPHTKQQDAAD